MTITQSTVSGNTVLSARAAPSSRRVEYVISGGPFLYLAHLGDATATQYGWVYTWDSKQVVDGTYLVKARAYDGFGHRVDGPQIQITVRNA